MYSVIRSIVLKSEAIILNTLFTISFGKTLMVLILLNQLTVVLILLYLSNFKASILSYQMVLYIKFIVPIIIYLN